MPSTKAPMTNANAQEITEDASRKLLKGISIPPQPQIVVDLQMEMASSNMSLNKISTIISKDIGIAGSVLKIVNSPYYGLPNKVISIQQALNLLGIDNVVNIVNALSLRNTLTFESIVEMTKIWDSAMDIAIASAAISDLIKLGPSDEAYTLGLFHNCGIPMLMNKFENYLKILNAAYSEPKQLITDIENEQFGCNHAVVGYFVAKAWRLPIHICNAIADHHKTEAIFSDKVPCPKAEKNLLAVLKLAEHHCQTYRVLGNVSRDYEFERIQADLLVYVGLSEYDFDDLLSQLKELHLSF
jgi:HD-like signal output (HDOD) protein